MTEVESVQFSDEYNPELSNESFKHFVSEKGRLLTGEEKLFTKIKSSERSRRNITPLLIVLAVIMLLIDIIFRRFSLDKKIKNILTKHSKKRTKDKNEVKDIVQNDVTDSKITDKDSLSEENQGEIDGGKKTNKKETKKYKNSSKNNVNDNPGNDTGIATLDTSALLKKKKDRNL